MEKNELNGWNSAVIFNASYHRVAPFVEKCIKYFLGCLYFSHESFMFLFAESRGTVGLLNSSCCIFFTRKKLY